MAKLKLNNPFKTKIKYLKDDGRPQSLVRTGGGGAMGIQSRDRSISDLRTYWDYYYGDGTIFAALNTTAWNTVMVGYNLIAEDEDAKKLIKNFFDIINIERMARQSTLYTLIFGDSFTEKVYNKGKDISRLKVIDSRTMLINSDEYGDVQSYQQEISGKKQPIIKTEYIMHLRFFEIPGSPYGVSLIAPNKDTIDRKVSTDEALFNAIKRHGTLKWVATVGSEKDGQIPPDSVMDNIKEELEDITEKNEFVVPWFIDLKTIDEQGIEGVEEYFNYFQTQLVIGLLCPEEALGLGKGSTEATARIKAIMYERMIKAFQHELENTIREELINPTLEKNGFDINTVHIKFNQVTEEDEALKAKWLGGLLRGFRDQDIPFTRNEIRSFFGLEPREDMEDVPKTKPKEDEEPEDEEPEEEDVDEEEEEDNDESETFPQ